MQDTPPFDYMIRPERIGYRLAFYCSLCQTSYTVFITGTRPDAEEFEAAQREAKRHFNRCHRCHRWVCDKHYNESVMMCTGCAPPEGEKRKKPAGGGSRKK